MSKLRFLLQPSFLYFFLRLCLLRCLILFKHGLRCPHIIQHDIIFNYIYLNFFRVVTYRVNFTSPFHGYIYMRHRYQITWYTINEKMILIYTLIYFRKGNPTTTTLAMDTLRKCSRAFMLIYIYIFYVSFLLRVKFLLVFKITNAIKQ